MKAQAHSLLDDYAIANEELCPVVLLDAALIGEAGAAGLTGGVWISWELVEDDARLRELMGALTAPTAPRPFPDDHYALEDFDALCGADTSPCSALSNWGTLDA